MAGTGFNPNTAQGSLNRVATHLVVPGFPGLNVMPGYMAKGQLLVTFDSESVAQLGATTGFVNSPNPYVMATIVVNLLRSQDLANSWINQYQSNSLIGDVSTFSDSTTFEELDFTNCAIQTFEPGPFDGSDPTVKVTIKGQFFTNSSMWADLTGTS